MLRLAQQSGIGRHPPTLLAFFRQCAPGRARHDAPQLHGRFAPWPQVEMARPDEGGLLFNDSEAIRMTG